MNCVMCETELTGKQERFCSNKCRQAEFRSRVIPSDIKEPFVILSPDGAERVARLATDIFCWPDDLTQEERNRICDPEDRIFLVRWGKALYGYVNGAEIWRVAIGYDRETKFEEQYRSNKEFKRKVRAETRAYDNVKSMAGKFRN